MALLATIMSSAFSASSACTEDRSRERKAINALPALTVCEHTVCAEGRPFTWNGVTAFALVDLVAEGRSDEARAFIAWARQTGFNVLRVLTMLPNGGCMNLSPEDGRRALPRVLELARAEGMYVQAVALANTDEASGRFRDHAFLENQVKAVGQVCAAATNCVLEMANEPYHGSQAGLDDPALMRRLSRDVPDRVLVTWGATDDDRSDRMAGGDFVVVHLARSGDWWDRVERASDLAAVASSTRKFVVDNEPIGAAERVERSRRDTNPDAFFAQGAASRLAGAGATFHCEDCLHARVPGSVQQEAARAFVEGRRALPSESHPVLAQDGEVATIPGEGRVLAATDRDRAWVLAMGPGIRQGLRWQDGWRADRRVVSRHDLELWTGRRTR
jgi:hypothetical protein